MITAYVICHAQNDCYYSVVYYCCYVINPEIHLGF